MKKQIVERLLKDGHISFDEALELMDVDNQSAKIETLPIYIGWPGYQPAVPQYPNPNAPWWVQPQITC